MGARSRIEVRPEIGDIRLACPADAAAVEQLIAPAVASGELLSFTPAGFSSLFAQSDPAWRFFVVEREGQILACGGLRHWTPLDAEIRTLCVAHAARGGGVGSRLVAFLESWARSFGTVRIFALTKCPEFFAASGYDVVVREQFPWKIAGDCAHCPRRSACDEIAVAKSLVCAVSSAHARPCDARYVPFLHPLREDSP
jgi:amino-acid N-acetyltransferase